MSPIHFHTPLCGHEHKCLPHTINENSNQSFEAYQTEKHDRVKISEGHGQIQSSPITGWDMPLLSSIECSELPNHYSEMRFLVNDPGINLSKSHYKNAINSQDMTLKRANESDLALFESSVVTSRINHCRGGKLLMPIPSQVATYNMAITSASTGS